MLQREAKGAKMIPSSPPTRPQYSHRTHTPGTALLASAALWSSAARSDNWMGLRDPQSQPAAASPHSACLHLSH